MLQILYKPEPPVRCLLLITVLASPGWGYGQDEVRKPEAGDPKTAAPPVAVLADSKPAALSTSKTIPLLNRPRIDGNAWKFVSAKRDAKPGQTWQMKKLGDEFVLECTGKPFGLVRSVAAYEDFKFGLQWRFPNGDDGNSGVLVHTGTEATVWPRAIQVQFHQPDLGAILPIGGARVATESKRVDVKSKPAGEWNTCVISSARGALSVEINGVAVSAVTGCEPQAGFVGLQSEGSVVQFRRIWIAPLTTGPQAEPSNGATSAATPDDSTDETAVRPEPLPAEEKFNGSIDLREPVPISFLGRDRNNRAVMALATAGPIGFSGVCDVRRSDRARRVLSRRRR